MSYRNITVDGVEYQYTIGRSHVKIKGHSVVEKADIGVEFETDIYVVCPRDIANWIKYGKKRTDHPKCKCGKPGNKTLRAWPFAREIHGKTQLTHACDDCLAESADNI